MVPSVAEVGRSGALGSSVGRVVRVLVDVAAVRRVFDYSVPARLDGLVGVGCLVRVPFSGRRVAGWVAEDFVTPPAGVTLRPLASVTGLGPPADLVDLSSWAAWRWAGRRSSFLRTASPPRVIRGLPRPATTPAPAAAAPPSAIATTTGPRGGRASPVVAPTSTGAEGRASTAVDELVREAFATGQAVVRLPPAMDTLPFVVAALHLGAGVVPVAGEPAVGPDGETAPEPDRESTGGERWRTSATDNASPAGASPTPPESADHASPAGARATPPDAAGDAGPPENSRLPSPGPGNTSPRSVLVLAPAVAEAAGAARRLRQAGWPVALMPDGWASAAAGASVVIGSRAAAWAPVPHLAAVVVLDAHEEVYQEERAPTWNAWQVGAERARRAGVPCVLVSPCPTLEQLDWGRLIIPSRAREREGWPALDIVDRRGDDPRQGLYSERLVRLLRSGEPVACILNRKGRARLLACTACTDLTRCEACQGAMEQRSGAGNLACRRCQLERAVVCQSCGSSRLKTLRVGVSRVREELEALANVPVGEVTAQSTSIPSTRVLVGTDALLHRLHTGRGGIVVAFLDFDQEVLAPRYRAGEQALALLARAARLVGGRGGGGRLLVQTRLPDHEVLTAALHADPGRLTDAERPRRVELSLPPASAVAQVSGPDAGAFVAGIPAGADTATGEMAGLLSDVEVLGPDDGRWLIRAADHTPLCDALAATPRQPGRYRVEVDPLRI